MRKVTFVIVKLFFYGRRRLEHSNLFIQAVEKLISEYFRAEFISEIFRDRRNCIEQFDFEQAHEDVDRIQHAGQSFKRFRLGISSHSKLLMEVMFSLPGIILDLTP